MTSPNASPRPGWIARAELLLLAIGIGLRMVRFMDQRPLWLDEAMLSLNVLRRSPIGLLQPLDRVQMSPLGFLWSEWLVTRLAGYSEHALRFLPMMAGVLGLMAFAHLARRLLEPLTALIATALAALSPLLIYYSAEVKSYGFDFLASVLLMQTTLSLAASPVRAAWLRWALAAAFGALFSTAAPLFVAGSALALVAAAPLRRNPRAWVAIIAAGTPAALIFLAQFFTIYHSSRTTAFMQLFWTESFLDLRSPGAVPQILHAARDLWAEVLFGQDMIESLPRKTMTVLLASSAVGLAALGTTGPVTPVLLLAPALFAGVASFAKLWPITPRLLLFVAPTILLTVPQGFATLARALPRVTRFPAQTLLSLAVVVLGVVHLPRTRDAEARFVDVPGALREIGQRATRDAAIYVGADLEAVCRYYLAWHPDRDRLRPDTSARVCRLRDTQTVIGFYPEFVGLRPGQAINGPRAIRPDWLQSEARRITDTPASEIWVLISNNALIAVLPERLEASGLRRTRERRTSTYLLVSYTRP